MNLIIVEDLQYNRFLKFYIRNSVLIYYMKYLLIINLSVIFFERIQQYLFLCNFFVIYEKITLYYMVNLQSILKNLVFVNVLVKRFRVPSTIALKVSCPPLPLRPLLCISSDLLDDSLCICLIHVSCHALNS